MKAMLPLGVDLGQRHLGHLHHTSFYKPAMNMDEIHQYNISMSTEILKLITKNING